MKSLGINCSLTVPVHTVSEANRREHWAAKAKRAKAQRQSARWHVAAQCVGEAVAGPVAVTLTRVAPRALDGDNLAAALKAVRDGVADGLGLGGGDRDSEWLSWSYAQRRGDRQEYAVEVRIEALAGGAR